MYPCTAVPYCTPTLPPSRSSLHWMGRLWQAVCSWFLTKRHNSFFMYSWDKIKYLWVLVRFSVITIVQGRSGTGPFFAGSGSVILFSDPDPAIHNYLYMKKSVHFCQFLFLIKFIDLGVEKAMRNHKFNTVIVILTGTGIFVWSVLRGMIRIRSKTRPGPQCWSKEFSVLS
jgi:hypothetical protein